jgi:hypothetical protein
VLLFDTNQLRQVLPGSLSLRLLAASAQRTGHRVAITDVVLHEVVRQRRDELVKRAAALAGSYEEFQRLLPARLRTTHAHPALAAGEEAFPGEQAGSFEQSLRQEFLVLKTSPDDALEALMREAGHRPPCSSSGKGGRDTSIWLTAARASRTPGSGESGQPLPVIFVSEDQAFADRQDRHRISPGLRADYPDPGMLILAPTVVDALSLIGYPSEEADAREAGDRIEFREALRDRVLQVTSPANGWDPELTVREIGLGQRLHREPGTARLDFPRMAGGRAQRCRGADVTLTSVAGTWTARMLTGEVPPEIAVEYSAAYGGLPLRITCSALVTQDGLGKVQEIDFSSLTVNVSLD